MATFSAYLWGIETRNEWCKDCRSTIFSLPMRDWNFFLFLLSEQEVFIFSLPMRDWNSLQKFIRLWIKIIFSLPMRDWNNTGHFNPTNNQIIFSLPMRDWNSETETEKYVLYPPYFQPTYEGLKRRRS